MPNGDEDAATQGGEDEGRRAMTSPADSRSDERVEGGYLSAEVSHELAAMMMGCTFLARMEVNGWLAMVASQGLHVETMSDVPDDLLQILRTGAYGDDRASAQRGDRDTETTWEEGGEPENDDSADPFDDQSASEQDAGGAPGAPDPTASSDSSDDTSGSSSNSVTNTGS